MFEIWEGERGRADGLDGSNGVGGIKVYMKGKVTAQLILDRYMGRLMYIYTPIYTGEYMGTTTVNYPRIQRKF